VFTARYGLGIYIKSRLILISKVLIRHETLQTVKQKKKKKKKKKNNNTPYNIEPRSYLPPEERG
jgi:hypothetical protein